MKVTLYTPGQRPRMHNIPLAEIVPMVSEHCGHPLTLVGEIYDTSEFPEHTAVHGPEGSAMVNTEIEVLLAAMTDAGMGV